MRFLGMGAKQGGYLTFGMERPQNEWQMSYFHIFLETGYKRMFMFIRYQEVSSEGRGDSDGRPTSEPW